jgi:nucleoside-diphosphate-sugar epimerase
MTRSVGITGAAGYLGSVLADRFAQDGWQVVALTRRPPDAGGLAWRRYELDAPLEAGLLDGLDLLVHAAYDRSPRQAQDERRVNVEGSRRLLEAAAAHPVGRTIVISSMSAYEGTTQEYGRAKLEVERIAFALDGCTIVVRPGLVYGPRAGGMAGALRRLLRVPLVPVVGGDSLLFTVHEDDLAATVVALAGHEPPPTVPVGIAHPQAVPFRDVLAELARQDGRRPRLVAVPWRPVLGAMRVAERLPVALPIRADSLLGLVRPANALPNAELLDDLGLSARPLQATGAAA